MNGYIEIAGRRIGAAYPAYVIAELSANHGQGFETAVKTIQAAKEAGADAVKLQTYTADTLTIRSNEGPFHVKGGTLWDGRSLYDLYAEAFTPWEWQPKLKALAQDLGIHLFSTAYDPTSVDFLEQLDMPVHKVSSFEIVDIPLIEKVAATGKPLILSTGMASLGEIEEAVAAARRSRATQIALLKCTSAYPAPPEEMHLRTIPHMAEAFGLPVGLSDHSLTVGVPVAAVALGACIVEKHFILSRSIPSADAAFSLEPAEFKAMVDAIRTAERALGEVHYGVGQEEAKSSTFRRSLFVVEEVKAGQLFTEDNVRSIRPAHGLPPKFFRDVVGRRATADIAPGTPLTWDLVRGGGS